MMDENKDAKCLSTAYSVDMMSTVWTFSKYCVAGGLFLGFCKLSSIAGVHPVWIVPIFSFLATMKAKRRESRNLRLEALKAILSSDSKLITRVHDLPKWVTYPDMEKAEWINKIIRQMWPNISHYVRNLLVTSVGPAVASVVPAFKFEDVVLGDMAPRVSGVRVYQDNVPHGEIIMDMAIKYYGDCSITCCAVKALKAGITDLEFTGTVRVIMTPLLKEMPLVGAVQVFFLNPPYVDFNLTQMADVLDFPGLSNIIRSTVTDVVSGLMVLPNKFMFPLAADIPKGDSLMPKPRGVLRVFIVEAKNLEKKDIGIMGTGKSDPFVKITVGSQTEKTKYIENTVTPVWNFCCEMLIDAVHNQELSLEVWDYDPGVINHDFLGSSVLDIKELACKGETDQWYSLKDVKKGDIHIKTSWKNISNTMEDFEQEKERVDKLTRWNGPKRNTAVLLVLLERVGNLPVGRGDVEPNPKVIFTLNETEHESVVKYKTKDPFYDQSFTLFARNPKEDHLNIKVVDAMKNNTLLEGSFMISELLSAKNLEILPKEIFLKGSTVVVVYLQLRILKSGVYGDDDIETQQDESQPLIDLEKQILTLTDVPETRPTDSKSLLNSDIASTDNSEEQSEICVEEIITASEAVQTTRSRSPPALDEAIKSTVEPVAAAASLTKSQITSAITDMKTVGEIQLTIRYNPTKSELVIVVHRAMNLPMEDEDELPDPYVKLYLHPDKEKASKRKTKAIKDSCNPVYDERLDHYTILPNDIKYRTLHVTVISKKRSFEIFKRSPLIGEARIDLGSLDLSKALTDTWPLYPCHEDE